MTTAIAEIIENDEMFIKRVSNYQLQRISELHELLARKQRGETIDVTPIILRWQEAGILDENGELTAPYRKED